MEITFDSVAGSVQAAVRREFGSAAEIEQVSQDDHSAVWGFTVDGMSYSLTLDRTNPGQTSGG